VTADRTVFLPVATRPSVETCVDHARRAQAIGYDRVWLAESWGRDSVTILTSVARETPELGIGASILPVYSRSPALLGQTAVTLQEVADGRVRIGLGPSSAAVVEGWHGATYGNPLKRTRETIEIARRVCTGAPVDYDGTYFDLEGFELRCEPPDTPPAIDAAGIGPKAVELAGRFADGWHALMLTREGLASRMAALRRGARLADRDPADPHVMATVFYCVRSDPKRAKELLKGSFAFYIGAFGRYFRESIARQGYEDVATTIANHWQRGDRADAAAAIPDDLLAQFGVWGTPDTAPARLDRFAAVEGVDAVGITFPQGTDRDGVRTTTEALAPDAAD